VGRVERGQRHKFLRKGRMGTFGRLRRGRIKVETMTKLSQGRRGPQGKRLRSASFGDAKKRGSLRELKGKTKTTNSGLAKQ